MNKFAFLILVALGGCASVKAPPECAGEAHRINAPSVSVSAVVCEKESQNG